MYTDRCSSIFASSRKSRHADLLVTVRVGVVVVIVVEFHELGATLVLLLRMLLLRVLLLLLLLLLLVMMMQLRSRGCGGQLYLPHGTEVWGVMQLLLQLLEPALLGLLDTILQLEFQIGGHQLLLHLGIDLGLKLGGSYTGRRGGGG